MDDVGNATEKPKLSILLRPHTHFTWLVHQRSGECDKRSWAQRLTTLRPSNNGHQPNRHLQTPNNTTILGKRIR